MIKLYRARSFLHRRQILQEEVRIRWNAYRTFQPRSRAARRGRGGRRAGDPAARAPRAVALRQPAPGARSGGDRRRPATFPLHIASCQKMKGAFFRLFFIDLRQFLRNSDHISWTYLKHTLIKISEPVIISEKSEENGRSSANICFIARKI